MKFTSKKSELVDKLIKDKEYLFTLTNSYGDLLNVILPEEINSNIDSFKECFKKHRIKGSIYYAHKCNHSTAIVNEMLNNNINIDVASLNELKHVLGVGFIGNKIEATGPKNDDFLILGLRHDILFNVDNIEELLKIIKFHKKLNKKEKTKVLIRLNNFSSKENKIIPKQSRFGININGIDEVIKILLENKDIVDIRGFSYHLDTIEVKEKAIAIENIIMIFGKCFELNLNPSVINIGGGFKVNYIENEEIWNKGITKIKENILTSSNELWNNATYGLNVQNGTLKGAINVYNYFDNIVKAQFLDEILSYKSVKFENRQISEILSDNMIELMIEPGKSLLDNVGINIAKVIFTKKSALGDVLVGLDMNRSNLLIGDQEMLVDPILITKNNNIINEVKTEDVFEKDVQIAKNEGVYFVGNLCMENDILYKHKIKFNTMPKNGDLLLFTNTAGYFMDFNESKTIMQNTARKIVVLNKNNKFESMIEENYDKFKQGDI